MSQVETIGAALAVFALVLLGFSLGMRRGRGRIARASREREAAQPSADPPLRETGEAE